MRKLIAATRRSCCRQSSFSRRSRERAESQRTDRGQGRNALRRTIPVDPTAIQASSERSERALRRGQRARSPKRPPASPRPWPRPRRWNRSAKASTASGTRVRRLLHHPLGPRRTEPAKRLLGDPRQRTSTSVGGCQYQLDEGDEVLWVWDAFKQRRPSPSSPKQPTTEGRGRPGTVAERQTVRGRSRAYTDEGTKTCPAKTPSRDRLRTLPGRRRRAGRSERERVPAGRHASPETVVTDAGGKATSPSRRRGSTGSRRRSARPGWKRRWSARTGSKSACGESAANAKRCADSGLVGGRREAAGRTAAGASGGGRHRVTAPAATPGPKVGRRSRRVEADHAAARPRPPRRRPGRGQLDGHRPRRRGEELDDLLAHASARRGPLGPGRAARRRRRRRCGCRGVTATSCGSRSPTSPARPRPSASARWRSPVRRTAARQGADSWHRRCRAPSSPARRPGCAADPAGHQALIDSTVRYLQETPERTAASPSRARADPEHQRLGGAGAGRGGDQPARPGPLRRRLRLRLPRSALRRRLPEEIARPQIAITALERELLVVDATGTDPHDFAGHDLAGEILARQLPDGSFPYVPGGEGQNRTTRSSRSWRSARSRNRRSKRRSTRAAGWVVQGRRTATAAGTTAGEGRRASEVDMTGAAIEALVAAGRRRNGSPRPKRAAGSATSTPRSSPTAASRDLPRRRRIERRLDRLGGAGDLGCGRRSRNLGRR